ncbi:MAG TPA: hypothetical protein VMH02_06250, partial [Verrucomicrobiae bacterium]|nr:hypothetical protein [Verrucomicrobiae bacterium]
IYHPGWLVEFSDTVYPIRPDLTFAHWMNWWSTDNFGEIWYNACWLPNLILPYAAYLLDLPLGLGQALQYFTWLAVPTIAVAFCIDRLTGGRPSVLSGLVVALLSFNIYIAASWTSSVAMYAFGAAALYAWALAELVECRRLDRGLLVAAAAAFWLSPDAGNPPYFILVIAHTAVFGTWLLLRNARPWSEALRVAGCLAGVSLLVSLRWLVPLVPFYLHPLTSVATGGAGYDFVTSRAHLINVLRFSPFWYWGDPHYTYYALLYERDPFLIFGSFLPFFVVLAALAQAIRKGGSRSLLALFGIVFGWIFLIKSNNVPFAGLSEMINALPLMSLFRDSEKLTGPLLIDMTVALGLAFAGVRFRVSVKAALGAGIVLGCLCSGWLVLTGLMFTGVRGIPPLYVRVPPAYGALAGEMARTGAHRAVTSPWDLYYAIGTRWGFLGADDELFNDLPDLPLFHHAVFSYIDLPNLDDFVHLYHREAWGDAVARESLDRRAGIDAAILRNDAMPYLGFETYAWRDGDLAGEFYVRDPSSTLAVYKAVRPVPFAYESSAALYAPSLIYLAEFQDLAQLGITGLPLIADAAKHPVPHAVELREFGAREDAVDAAAPMRAFLFNPRGLRDGAFSAPPGEYDVVLRAAMQPVVSFKPNGPDARPLPDDGGLVMNQGTDLVRGEDTTEPQGAWAKYVSEAAGPTRATLEVPVLGRTATTCGRVSVNDHLGASYAIPPGRSTIAIDATLLPGKNDLDIEFGDPPPCRAARLAQPPLYAALAATAPVFGRPVRDVQPRRIWARGFDVDAALSQYPTVRLDYLTPQVSAAAAPVPPQFLLRARVAGAGCNATVAGVGDKGSPVTLDVVQAFDDIGRRPALGRACLRATLAQLHVRRIDVVAIGASDRDIAELQSVSLRPARPAIDWHAIAGRRHAILRAGSSLGVHPLWTIAASPYAFSQRPVLDLVASSLTTAPVKSGEEKQLAICPGVTFGFSSTLPEGTILSVDPIFPYVLISDANGPNGPADYDPTPHIQIPLGDLAMGAGAAGAETVPAIALEADVTKRLKYDCVLALDEASIGVESTPASVARVAIDGRTLVVPRDDRPHRYRVSLAGDAHRLSVQGPLEEGGVFAAGLLAAPHPVAANAGGLDADLPQAGWLVYTQAFDPAWGAWRGLSPLPAFRTDLDLQAYYVDSPGRVRVRMWLGALRPITELITWLGVLALLVGCLLFGRRAFS